MAFGPPIRTETRHWGSVEVYLENTKADLRFYQDLIHHLASVYEIHQISKAYLYLHRIEITEEPITVKIVKVRPHSALDLAMHKHMEETWLCLRGIAVVVTGPIEEELSDGDYAVIHPGTKHRLSSIEGCEILEVTYGEFTEKDIIRFEDEKAASIKHS
jgi:mannose-6-phosphate isomerase-like protein (cupin superfamily)